MEVSEYKSNEICSRCLKEREQKLTLDIREWVCSNCNTLLDRDINAAINILRFGSEMLRIYLLRSPAVNGGEASPIAL